ncbi:hypothetical protein [Chondrinema litorale]|uniref:hypothetical protein n=1 Tax=Chondrinema litorale TaxID=2994555 RepID=UPI0025429C9A|nr:hypothetical protein [Chondrinema litorale]UZR98926.1 hypothetical protein OQ292_34310 [Chondrinema litorale]
MKKIFISIIVLIFFTSIVPKAKFRDKIDIKWSNLEKSKLKKTPLGDVVGHDETGIYVKFLQPAVEMGIITLAAGGVKFSYLLQHYDNDMKLTSSKKIELDKGYELESVFQFGDELYLMSTFNNKDIRKKELFVQKINKKTLNVEQEKKRLAASVNMVAFNGNKANLYNDNGEGAYDYIISRDKTKLLVYFKQTTENKSDNEIVGVQVYEAGFNMLWSNTYEIPFENELFSIRKVKVNNDGKVYLLGKEYKEKHKNEVDGLPNFKYRLLCLSELANKFDTFIIDLEDKFITDIELTITEKQNEVICSGFYSENDLNGIIGSFYFRFDTQSNKIVSSTTNQFSDEFLLDNAYSYGKKMNKIEKIKEKGLTNYSLDQVILREDGGIVLISEYKCSLSSNSSSRVACYNILSINISPSGEVEWSTKIDKKQLAYSDDEYIISYETIVIKDKIYFIFNDEKENILNPNLENIKAFKPNKMAITSIVELGSDGVQHKEILFAYQEINLFAIPDLTEQISENEVILFAGQTLKGGKLAKLTFK